MLQYCKMYLRKDQSLSQRQTYSSPEVKVFAPSWIQPGVELLTQQLSELECLLYDNAANESRETKTGAVEDFYILLSLLGLSIPVDYSKGKQPAEKFTFGEEISKNPLKTLQKCSRNLPYNINGTLNPHQVSGIDGKIFLSLHDLTRQCVIVGVDTASKYGGYNCKVEAQERKRVYVCDLAALQFQMPHHTGRLVLIGEENYFPTGVLDDFIFENVVGQKKKLFKDVQSLQKENPEDLRYIFVPQLKCYIDTEAYQKFVENDVILFGLSVCKLVREFHPEDKIHFKFLKYGTGAYAFKFADILEKHILPGVLSALEVLLKTPDILNIIRRVELPFYEVDGKYQSKIEALENAYGIKIIFSKNDALKHSDQSGLIVATTNCGDNLAPCGNNMGYGSVDGSIAENLDSKGNILCPNINLSMGEEFIQLPNNPSSNQMFSNALAKLFTQPNEVQKDKSDNQPDKIDDEDRTHRFGDNNRSEFSFDKNTIQQQNRFHSALLFSSQAAQQNTENKLKQEIQSNADLSEAWEKAETLFKQWQKSRAGLNLESNTYECHIALICYTLELPFYRNFNAACRNLKTVHDFKQFKYRYYYETLSLAIFNGSGESPKISKETVLYRGMNIQVPTSLKAGDLFAFFHVTSTSVNRNVATQFTEKSGGIGTLFEIRGMYDSGMKKYQGGSKKFPCNVMPMGNHSIYQYENEVLIRPFQEYVVDKITPNPKGLTVVYLKA